MNTTDITPQGHERAQAAPEPDVSFGPNHSDAMSLTWASECLTWLYEHDRQTFGRMLLGRLGIEQKRAGRKPAE
jgi:hypothetical protein